MANEEREELIEKMAIKISAERGWLTDWGKYNQNEKNALKDIARAALAVAEPLIRERCAELADKMGVISDGHEIAAAIREGGKE